MTKLTQNEQQFLSESIRVIPNFPKEKKVLSFEILQLYLTIKKPYLFYWII